MLQAYKNPMEDFEIDVKKSISDFMAGYSCETTPEAARKTTQFRALLEAGSEVYITSLPGAILSETVETALKLRNEGLVPVPHIAARSITDATMLNDLLDQLVSEAAVDEVLLIGGGLNSPIGDFSDTMQLLETGLFDRFNINRINVAGHPEGSPDISDEYILAALAWKNAFAERTGADMQIVTQFCFESAPIIAWDKAIQAAGNRLPIRIGLPGLATIKTLINYARSCGVGPSMRFLTRQARNLTKLLTVAEPDRLVAELAAYQSNTPSCGIVGAHMFPLGGLKRTAAWSNAVAQGRFELKNKGGFSVNAEIR